MAAILSEVNRRAERVGTGAKGDYGPALSLVEDRLAVLNQLRDASGTAVGEGITQAHKKLLVAANDNTTGPAEFAAAVGELADAVKALRAGMAAQAKTSAAAPATAGS